MIKSNKIKHLNSSQFSIIVILIFFSFNLFAVNLNNKLRIKIKIEGVKDTSIFLANYYGSKAYKICEAKVNKKGEGIFEYTKPLDCGIYLIYLDDKKYFDFLLGNERELTIKANFDEPANNQYFGAAETEAFHQYQLFLTSQREKLVALQNELKLHSQNSDSTLIIHSKMLDLNSKMEEYWKNSANKLDGTFFADFMRMMIIPQPPETELPQSTKNVDSIKWVNQYNYVANHYWDYFNFAQAGLLQTPIIDGKIDEYFKKSLLQIPDTIVKSSVRVIEKSKANSEMYKYFLLYLLNFANTSEVMGMDKAFVELAEKYVLSGEADWIDSLSKEKIKEKVATTKPNLIGNYTPDLKLPDSEGNYYSLIQLNSKYTILYFWEPDCSHCQKITPQLQNELSKKFSSKDVDVFAVCTQTDREKWLQGIQKYAIHDWTNVWDPLNQSDFRKLYGITATPEIFIIDQQKKIIAKRIDVETAIKFLEAKIKSEL